LKGGKEWEKFGKKIFWKKTWIFFEKEVEKFIGKSGLEIVQNLKY